MTSSLLVNTFLLTSTDNIILYTADANITVLAEVISRDEDFPKSVRIYKLVETNDKMRCPVSEGDVARRSRRQMWYTFERGWDSEVLPRRQGSIA